MNSVFFDSRIAGYFFALLAAVTYGLNPFFGISLYQEGLSPLSVLFYRFLFAAFFMALVLLAGRKSFRVSRRYWGQLLLGGLAVALTCLFWFMTFRIMDSGIAAAMLFIYPVQVALIMYIFFRERLNRGTVAGIFLALAGVVVLCQPGSGSKTSTAGVICIFLSALVYALYIVGVKKSRLKELDSSVLTFYAMLLAIPVFWISLRFGVDLQMLPSLNALGNAVGLGLFPSLCSFLFTALAIHRIGPTHTSVLGAMEPVTAVLIGVFFFHENMTAKLLGGIVLILAAVILVICSQEPSDRNILAKELKNR